MDVDELKRSLTAIEKKSGEGLEAATALGAELGGRVEGVEKKMEKLEVLLHRPRAAGHGGAGGAFVPPEAREHLDVFVKHLRRPKDQVIRGELAAVEQKAASGLSDGSGGALVPELLLNRIFDQAKSLTAMRRLATVAAVSSGDAKFPINRNDASSAWVGETDTRNPTSEPTLLERKPTIGTVFSYVQASEELVYDSAFDIASWFTQAVGDELALAEGTAFISGNGSNKPTGLLHVAPVVDLDASPVPDSKAILYVPTGVSGAFPNDLTGSPAGDPAGVLMEAVFALKAQYRANGRWLMNSQTAKTIARWRDADGRFLLQPAMVAGMPATLLGYPLEIDEAMPDLAANSLPIVFGDFLRGYLVVDAGGLRVTVDDNITTPGRIKWYLRKRVGGIVADNRALVAIKASTT